MNYKFLITLLTSSNEHILKLSYDCAINQLSHNLDYTIIIVVNSLDKTYFNTVCNVFKNINVEIVETLSNGKPGMGHNSLFKIFYEKKIYDYLIPIDGDDFLYPYALHQITKCFNEDSSIDCVCIYGNDTIRDYNSGYDNSDIYLMNHFYLRMGYNIPKIFGESDLLVNPFTYNINNGVQTIIRLILCSKNFVKHTLNTELYCEKCNILDDYRFYLNFVDNIITKNLKGLIINSDHIYLYNNINNKSVSKVNINKFNDDYKIIINYLNDFKHLQTSIKDWNLSIINYKNLTPVFNEDLEFVSQGNSVYSFNKDNLEIKENYIYIVKFAKILIVKYYKVLINIIEYNLFKNLNVNKAYELCTYLINNKVCDRKLFIYTAICYFYLNDKVNTLKYIEKSSYMVDKYEVLKNFYLNNK